MTSEAWDEPSEVPIRDSEMELIVHYGTPIAQYLLNKDSSITSICINRYDDVWIRREGVFIHTDARWPNAAEFDSFIKMIPRKWDQTEADAARSPISDTRLSNGSRINAVLYPTATRGSNVTIRLFPKVRFTVEDLLARGMFTAEMLAYMKRAVLVEANGFIVGASGSGKTTILNAIGNQIPRHRRGGVVEDTSELNFGNPNMVYMEAPRRQVNTDMPITMERLIINTLRQELQYVIVGEIREPATATALQIAYATGHRGVWGTLHAKSAAGGLRRYETMLLSNDTRVPFEAVRADIRDSIDVVIYVERTPMQGQRVVELAEIDEHGELRVLWEWDYRSGTHVRLFNGQTRLDRMAVRYGLS